MKIDIFSIHMWFRIYLFLIIIIPFSCNKKNATNPTDWQEMLPNDHLSDEELLTKEDPDAPTVKEAWKTWVNLNSMPIRSLTSTNYSDLSFLENYLVNVRIVQMGEITHGAAKQNAVRVRIIKYLHENMGFNVVAFESGFYEAWFSNKKIEKMGDYHALKNSIAGRWNTSELLDLIRYIKNIRRTNNPLFLAGFDVRPSTKMIDSRPNYFQDIMVKIDSTFAETLFKADSVIVTFYKNSDSVREYIINNYIYLRDLYGTMVESININRNQLLNYYTEEEYKIALECAESAHVSIDNLKGGNYYVRDRHMAETIKFLSNDLYKDEKIIIWAHNEHIFENSTAIQNEFGTQVFATMMGTWLKNEFGPSLFSIGSFSYRGTVNASGPIVTLDINTPNCLEAILYNSRKKFCFIDFSQESHNEGNSWLFQNIQQTRFHRTGNYTIFYKAFEQFDGVLFIDKENPPIYF